MSETGKKRGRPAKEPDDLITVDQAREAIKEYWLKKTGNPELAEKCTPAKGTLYNKSASGQLHKWKKGKHILLSRAEVLKLVS